MNRRSLVWFRNDLRVADNAALVAARERGDVVGIFVLAPAQWRGHGIGANRLSFLLRSVLELSRALARLNIPLLIRSGDRFCDHASVLAQTAGEVAADAIFCNEEYPLDEKRRDAAVGERCREARIEFRRTTGNVIQPPGSVLTAAGQPYSVFTPFERRWLAQLDSGALDVLSPPRPQTNLGIASSEVPDALSGVGHDVLAALWPGGESPARQRLAQFAGGALHRYREDRDRPDRDGTSRLSPYLSLGTISARQCMAAARSNDGSDVWRRELIWRDFFIHVVAGFPDLSRGRAFRQTRVVWREDPVAFDAWRSGRTGYPLVDAAMRQLAATGWMHNRLRMLAAMFLTKHLLLDWRLGERHFMELLVDGDFAANNGGWQWSASTGTDAAPYFRIFNPVAQAKKFDPEGAFVRQWIPELAGLTNAAIFEPWRFGGADGYPQPIIVHDVARRRALAAFGR